MGTVVKIMVSDHKNSRVKFQKNLTISFVAPGKVL